MSRSHQTVKLVRWPSATHDRPTYRIALSYPTTGWPGHRCAAALQCSARIACSGSKSSVSGAATRPRPHIGIDLRNAALRAMPRHNLEKPASPRRDARSGATLAIPLLDRRLTERALCAFGMNSVPTQKLGRLPDPDPSPPFQVCAVCPIAPLRAIRRPEQHPSG